MFSSVVTVHPTLVCGFDDDKVGRGALVSWGALQKRLDQSRSDLFSTEWIQHKMEKSYGSEARMPKAPRGSFIGAVQMGSFVLDIDVV